MANFTRVGYGQIEPNQLSAQVTAEVYASLPLSTEVEVLQNGEFMKYDYAKNEVNTSGRGEWMLVYNEVKLYDDAFRHSYKDFAMIRRGDNFITEAPVTGQVKESNGATIIPPHTEYGFRMDGFAPRLLKTNIGDIFTTNMVKVGVEYTAGDLLTPVINATTHTAVLEKIDDTPVIMLWQVAKVYTMPDMQPGLKLMRVQ